MYTRLTLAMITALLGTANAASPQRSFRGTTDTPIKMMEDVGEAADNIKFTPEQKEEFLKRYEELLQLLADAKDNRVPTDESSTTWQEDFAKLDDPTTEEKAEPCDEELVEEFPTEEATTPKSEESDDEFIVEDSEFVEQETTHEKVPQDIKQEDIGDEEAELEEVEKPRDIGEDELF